MLQDVPTMLGGRYRVVERLGRGGMADVYRAEDTVLRRSVAIKIFRGGVERDHHLARFRTEVKTLAALTHPHLVALYDAGGDITEPWCAMEYVNGGSLADREGIMSPAEAATVGEQVASALAYVHGQGIVHRDVKPSNVLMDSAGGAFLSDFGIARLVDGTRMTQSGLMIGTAAFLSPEQVRGQSAGPASDVYALGLVLLEVLTGRREYPGTPVESAVARLTRSPQVPAEFGADWVALIEEMTLEDARQRPGPDDVTGRLQLIAEQTAGIGPLPAVAQVRQPGAGGQRAASTGDAASLAEQTRISDPAGDDWPADHLPATDGSAGGPAAGDRMVVGDTPVAVMVEIEPPATEPRPVRVLSVWPARRRPLVRTALLASAAAAVIVVVALAQRGDSSSSTVVPTPVTSSVDAGRVGATQPGAGGLAGQIPLVDARQAVVPPPSPVMVSATERPVAPLPYRRGSAAASRKATPSPSKTSLSPSPTKTPSPSVTTSPSVTASSSTTSTTASSSSATADTTGPVTSSSTSASGSSTGPSVSTTVLT